MSHFSFVNAERKKSPIHPVHYVVEIWYGVTRIPNSVLLGEVFVIPADPADMKVDSRTLTGGDDTIDSNFRAQQRCKSLIVLEPFLRWTERVHKHNGMRCSEALRLDDC